MKVELSHTQAYHPDYRRYRPKAKRMQEMLSIAGNRARKHLSFDPGVHVVIKPIRRLNRDTTVNGMYYNVLKMVEIDVRYREPSSILSTLMHELVHAEQYFTGKLSRLGPAKFGWEGKLETEVKFPMSIGQYMALPWEEEAYRREGDLARQIIKEMCDAGEWNAYC